MDSRLRALLYGVSMALACSAVAACVVEPRRPPPPPPPTPPPGPGCVWVPGHWTGPYRDVWKRAHWRCP